MLTLVCSTCAVKSNTELDVIEQARSHLEHARCSQGFEGSQIEHVRFQIEQDQREIEHERCNIEHEPQCNRSHVHPPARDVLGDTATLAPKNRDRRVQGFAPTLKTILRPIPSSILFDPEIPRRGTGRSGRKYPESLRNKSCGIISFLVAKSRYMYHTERVGRGRERKKANQDAKGVERPTPPGNRAGGLGCLRVESFERIFWRRIQLGSVEAAEILISGTRSLPP